MGNDRKLRKVPKQSIWIDSRGRTTIPSYLLEAAGIKKPGWVEIEANPSLEECKSLFIKKTWDESSEKSEPQSSCAHVNEKIENNRRLEF